MRVLVLGGTGSIGRPIVRELIRCGHDVMGLARSPESERKLTADGARAVAGDIRAPEAWLAQVPTMDAVIHAAATFKDDEQTTDRHLLDRLLPLLATSGATSGSYTPEGVGCTARAGESSRRRSLRSIRSPPTHGPFRTFNGFYAHPAFIPS